MALTLGDNFSYGGSKPLDARLKYATLADMKSVADATMYDGCLAYCVATDKTYQWKSTNTVDTDTGRWREFETGGGGVTPVITATATADATSSATPTVNVTKTGTDAAPNFAFSFSGLKGAKGDTGATGVGCKNYSTSEQDTGLTWINGKKIYQKTLAITIPTTSASGTTVSATFSIGANIDSCIDLQAFAVAGGSNIALISPCWIDLDTKFGVNFFVFNNSASSSDKNKIRISNNFTAINGAAGYATLKYTKA